MGLYCSKIINDHMSEWFYCNLRCPDSSTVLLYMETHLFRALPFSSLPVNGLLHFSLFLYQFFNFFSPSSLFSFSIINKIHGITGPRELPHQCTFSELLRINIKCRARSDESESTNKNMQKWLFL